MNNKFRIKYTWDFPPPSRSLEFHESFIIVDAKDATYSSMVNLIKSKLRKDKRYHDILKIKLHTQVKGVSVILDVDLKKLKELSDD